MRRALIMALVVALVPAAGLAASGSSLNDYFVVPAAAHVAGQGGTYWRTDVSIVNPYTWRSITVYMKLLRANEDNSGGTVKSRTIAAGRELRFVDVVDTLFAASGNGAILIYSNDGALFAVSARTYTGEQGTYGQTEDGQDYFSVAGSVSFIGGLRNDADFRTNVGAVNASSSTLKLKAEVFSSDGTLLGSKTFTIKPWSQTQTSITSFAGSFASGWVRWTCTSTSSVYWVAYASVVDNATGDAVFLDDRRDSQGTRFHNAYDLSGWWSGSFSGPQGSALLYVFISQNGSMVEAWSFNDEGYTEIYLYGWEDQGALSVIGGYWWWAPCWDAWVTGGQATTNGNSVSGSYQETGCINGTTTFHITRDSYPPFGAAVPAAATAAGAPPRMQQSLARQHPAPPAFAVESAGAAPVSSE